MGTMQNGGTFNIKNQCEFGETHSFIIHIMEKNLTGRTCRFN